MLQLNISIRKGFPFGHCIGSKGICPTQNHIYFQPGIGHARISLKNVQKNSIQHVCKGQPPLLLVKPWLGLGRKWEGEKKVRNKKHLEELYRIDAPKNTAKGPHTMRMLLQALLFGSLLLNAFKRPPKPLDVDKLKKQVDSGQITKHQAVDTVFKHAARLPITVPPAEPPHTVSKPVEPRNKPTFSGYGASRLSI